MGGTTEFYAAASYGGRRIGYVFTSGAKGLGYYRDRKNALAHEGQGSAAGSASAPTSTGGSVGNTPVAVEVYPRTDKIGNTPIAAGGTGPAGVLQDKDTVQPQPQPGA